MQILVAAALLKRDSKSLSIYLAKGALLAFWIVMVTMAYTMQSRTMTHY